MGGISPDLAKAWGTAIKVEADGRRIITYCAGCTNHLNAIASTSHILDLLFEPKATLAGNAKASKGPITYINRLRLKSRLRKSIDARVARERTFTADEKRGFRFLDMRKKMNAQIIFTIKNPFGGDKNERD